MNSRRVSMIWILPLFLLSYLGTWVPDAGAQARGWCEQKPIVRASSLNERLTMPDVAAEGDRIYVVYRQANIKLIRSTDRGKTWSAPVDIGPAMRVTNAPTIAVKGEKIIVVWPALVDTQGLAAFQLFSSQSNDGGNTFSTPKRITDTPEDTFSPRFLVTNNQVLLLWLETPLAQTLGSISTLQRPDFSPESVDDLYNTRIKQGSLEDRMTRVRSTIYTRSYSFETEIFSTPNKVDVLRGQSLPHIFTMYGPLDGSLFITANQNTEVRTYESKDGGQNWNKYFKGQEYFDPRIMMDVLVVDGKRNGVWIERTWGQLIAVRFASGEDVKNYTSLSPEQYVRYLPRMSFSDGVFHVVWEAGEEINSWITYIRTDAIPPESKVTSPTDPALTERTATFFWEGSDNISDTNRLVYAYSLDNGTTWSAPQADTKATVNTPPDGEYVFKVRAEDVAGNIQEKPAEFAFNTFKSAPDVRITQAPPPSVVLNKRSVEIEFVGDDNSDTADQMEYSTQTDDQEWTPFAKGSKYTFTDLSNGQHILRIRVRDSRGNVDSTPAQCMVNVQVGLELILGTRPALSTNEEISSFDWKAVDDKGNPVTLQYFYRLNNGEVQSLNNETKLELKDLEEGRHRIEIWGRDASGDETQKESYQWLVDRTPPETTAFFTKEYRGSFPALSLGMTDPALTDGSTTTQPRKIQYQIDNGPWIDQDDAGSIWPAPKPLSFYSWGYVVKIRAIDVSGNIDESPATVDLRIWVRTNPYVFYSIMAVFAILILFLLKMLLSSFASRSPRRSLSTSSASSTLSFGEESKKEDAFSSSFSFDDEDEDKQKKNDDDIFS